MEWSGVKSLSRVRLFATPRTVAYQDPQSMGFFRQEYWSRLLFPSPGDPPDPGTEPGSPTMQADALPSEPPGEPSSVVVVVSVTQSCLTLFEPMDSSMPGSSVHGMLQARILEWTAILFSRGSSWPRDWTRASCVAGRFFTIWVTLLYIK